MPYPSTHMQSWLINVQVLIDAPREHKTAHSDGFCICEIGEAIEYAPREQQPDLVCGLFWSIWIDQVLYFVLVDGGIPECERDQQLYTDLRQIYRFPKFYSHWRGFSSPHLLLYRNSNIINGEQSYLLPDSHLLIEYRNEYWGEIREWLINTGRQDVIPFCLRAFSEDISARFENMFSFLVDGLE